MSINCKELNKIIPKKELRDYLKHLDELVSSKSKVNGLTLDGLKGILKQNGYSSIESWLTDIYKKAEVIGNKELTYYIGTIRRGQEVSSVITSNVIAYTRKSTEANMMGNTIETLENIFKKNKTKLENKISRAEVIDDYKRVLLKDATDMDIIDDMIRNEKDLALKETKIYYYDNDLDIILERYKKNKREGGIMLKNYIVRLKQKKAIKQAEAFMEGTYGGTLSLKYKNFLKKIGGENANYFMNLGTVKRNVNRIQTNGELKVFNNLFTLYNNSIHKYEDFMMSLRNRTNNIAYNTEKQVKNLVDNLNQYGHNVSIEYKDVNGNYLLKDKTTGLTYIYNGNALQNDENSIIKYFSEIGEGEGSLKSLSDTEEKINNGIEGKQFPETISNNDIDRAMRYIKEYEKTGKVEGDLEIIDSIINSAIKKLKLQDDETINFLININNYVPNLIADKVDKFNLYQIAKIVNTGFLAQLQSNQEFIKGVDINLSNILKSANFISEQNVAHRMDKLFNMFDLLKDYKNADDIITDEVKYATLELLSKKELDDVQTVNAIEEIYNTIKKNNPTDTQYSIIEKMGIQLEAYMKKYGSKNSSPIWQIRDTSGDNIANKIKKNLEILKEARTSGYRAGYIGYILSKYKPEEILSKKLKDIVDVNKIADDYYDAIKKYIPGLDYTKFIDEFSKSIFKTMASKKNLLNGFMDIRSSFKDLDNALSKSVLGSNGYSIVSGDSFIRHSLENAGVNNNKALTRIVEDLHGKSLYSSNWFIHKLGKLRGYTSRILLATFGPKGIGISVQNLFSGIIGALTRFSYNPEIARTIGKHLSELENLNIMKIKGLNLQDKIQLKKELGELLHNTFNPGENQLDKWLDESNEGGPVNYVLGKLSNELGQKAVRVGKNVEKAAFGLPGMVDDIIYKQAIKDRVLSKIYQEKGISSEQIKDLVNRIKEGDLGAKEDLKKLLTDVKKEALDEYQTFFKSAYNNGLMRNNFSRMIFINFFGSWGSKMLGEYLFHMFLEPLKIAAITLKHTGNKASAMEAFLHVIASSDRTHAFLHQLYIGYKMTYELKKDENVDGDPVEILKNTTLAYQGWISNVLSRALENATSQYVSTDGTVGDKLFVGAVKGIDTLLGNTLRETQVFGSLIKAYGQIVVNGGSPADAWYITKKWFTNNITNSANFVMFDLFNGELFNRFDGKDRYGLVEGIVGFGFTKRSKEKEDIMEYLYGKNITNNKDKNIGDLFNLSILGSNWLLNKQLKNHKLGQILSKDSVLQEMTNKGYVPDDLYEDPKFVKGLQGLFRQSDLLEGWDLKNSSSIEHNKLSLVLKELQDKGINTNGLINIIQSNLVNHKEKELIKLTALVGSKAGAAVLIANAASKLYKDKIYEFKKIYGKTIPDEVKNRIAAGTYRLLTPTMMRLDKHFHAQTLGLYIKNKYIDNDTTGEYQKLFGKNISKEMKVKLFAEVVDLDKVDWDNSKLKSYPVMLSTKFNKKEKVEGLKKIFDWIDDSGVTYGAKLTAQAGTLYANFTQIKELLNSDPATFGGAAENLANMIWTTDEKITKDPNFLDGVINSNGGSRRVKGTHINIPKVKKAKAIKQAVSTLKDTIIKNPKFKDYVRRKTHEQIHNKISPFTYKLPKYDFSIRKEKLKGFEPGELRTKILETKAKYIKSKRVRKPKVSNVEKVFRKTKSDSSNRKAVKPSRTNR